MKSDGDRQQNVFFSSINTKTQKCSILIKLVQWLRTSIQCEISGFHSSDYKYYRLLQGVRYYVIWQIPNYTPHPTFRVTQSRNNKLPTEINWSSTSSVPYQGSRFNAVTVRITLVHTVPQHDNIFFFQNALWSHSCIYFFFFYSVTKCWK